MMEAGCMMNKHAAGRVSKATEAAAAAAAVPYSKQWKELQGSVREGGQQCLQACYSQIEPHRPPATSL